MWFHNQQIDNVLAKYIIYTLFTCQFNTLFILCELVQTVVGEKISQIRIKKMNE